MLLYYARMGIGFDKKTYNLIVIFTSIFFIPHLRVPTIMDIFHTTTVCMLKILYFSATTLFGLP